MMKRTFKILTALILCISILMIPMQVMAAPEDQTNKTLYISEVKVGMGETSEEASQELLKEGFTIIKDDDGEYADLNKDAGTNSGMKEGPTDKIVYIGYKTTDDPKQAITDLAVMNMNGGYSVEDYEVLMANHLESEIKPFVDRFIAALNEYRINYKKPKNTLNHIRANYYRQMLNKLTDDDTGKPLGDLLLTKTKYEMGDEAYNDLSEKEKKKHADILTLLLQGNGKAVLLLETLISRATDTSEKTWLERFVKIESETLKTKIKKANPSLSTEADIEAELDKTYYDTAMKIYQKWDEFSGIVNSYDDNANAVINADTTDDEELNEKVKKIDPENPTKEDNETIVSVMNTRADRMETVFRGEEVVIIDYLDATPYEDGTLLDFFGNDQSVFEGDGIRSLYPIAASLSAGQIACLDFFSLKDLFSMALTDEEGYNKLDIEEMMTASIYQDVDRQIYEPGGVALTNAALRAGAKATDKEREFMLSPLGFVFWGLTSIAAAATITTAVLHHHYAVKIKELNSLENLLHRSNESNGTLVKSFSFDDTNSFDVLDDTLDDIAGYTTKSNVTKYLAIGFFVISAVLAGYSIYTTITEMLDYYKVTFTPIPRYIVDEADITQEINGTMVVINNQTAYYKVVSCNRKEGSSDVEKENYKILGTANDLNGDVGKQWLSLYSVKYKFGRPILADSLKVVKGTDALPKGYETGIHRFGEKPAFNLTSKYYCYNDAVKGTYVYFKNAQSTVAAMTMKTEEPSTEKTSTEKTSDDKNTTGSLFSAGSIAMGAGAGLLLGGGIAVLILLPRLKKKKEQQDVE